MEPRVSLITLGVSDLERARRFYVDGLDLPVRDGGDGAVVFIQMNGLLLALWGREALAEDAGVAAAGEGFPGFSLAHNVASKEEVDIVLREALAAGGTLVKPATKAFWGGYTAYFADPDGFLWEVAWNPFMPDLAGVDTRL